MITLEMSLIPYGERVLGTHPVLVGSIRSANDPVLGDAHAYRLSIINAEASEPHGAITGAIRKERSGHRNPLHLLRAIVDDIDLPSLGLASDYAATMFDLPEGNPPHRRERQDRIQKAADDCIDLIAGLASLGPEGEAALERIADALSRVRAGLPVAEAERCDGALYTGDLQQILDSCQDSATPRPRTNNEEATR